MRFDELHDLAAAYALGALDADEAAAFESHLDACERCRREVVDHSAVVEALADAEAVAPPPELRERVLDEIARTPQSPDSGLGSPVEDQPDYQPAVVPMPITRDGVPDEADEAVVDLTQIRVERNERRFGRVLAAAAAIVFVIGGAAAFWRLSDRSDAYDTVATSADAETLELEGEGGTITVVYSPERDQVGVLGTDLPDPGPGKTYELWLVVDDGVAPAGLFVPDNGSVRQVLSVDDIDTQGFGVTIEPEGGSEQPTGDILYLGTF